ncbi:MAG: hypothetical protein AAB553_07545 [Patescibacteria group bacterium]
MKLLRLLLRLTKQKPPRMIVESKQENLVEATEKQFRKLQDLGLTVQVNGAK